MYMWNFKTSLENVAIIAMYCHLRPPDVITFEASNLSCRRKKEERKKESVVKYKSVDDVCRVA